MRDMTPQKSDLLALVDLVAVRVEQRLRAPGALQPCQACDDSLLPCPDDVRNMLNLGASRIAANVGHVAAAADLAPFIDHTLLRADATRNELLTLCDEAKAYGFASVCVNATNVQFCAAQLQGCGVKTITVVGFPLGACTTRAKAFEAEEAVRKGAQEIDMVCNIGALKSRDYATVLRDINAVVRAAGDIPVKVILETAMLDHHQKVIGCALAKIAGAAFVKTSTGFGPGGATPADIALMRAVVGPDMGVKASGGVRTASDARAMMEAGADRIGASASVSIIKEEPPFGACKPAEAHY